MQKLHTLDEARALVRSGKPLLIAADEALLTALPQGNWVGGTIPYFMTAEGGLQTAEKLFITELPDALSTTVHSYDAASLPHIAADHPGHGFTVLLLPAFSDIHAEFAGSVPDYPGIFNRPLVGWVAGVALGDVGKVSPKVFNGLTGAGSSSSAVALHVVLPEADEASVDIVNLFSQGDGPEIIFDTVGFSAQEVSIGGARQPLASYLIEQNIDSKLPLVADYHGAMVNVSVRNIDTATNQVDFYAPVFPGVIYKIAAPVADYAKTFADRFSADGLPVTFSYNCILNYAYAGLEGKSTGRLVGPMTFGEIAYMLLNQTAVFLTIQRGG